MAFQLRAWTYWEGPRFPVQDVCRHSVDRVLGNLHVHITPENLSAWADLPDWAWDLHVAARSDMIRALLLRNYGGLWLDADVLLLRDPFERVGTVPVAWREQHMGGKYKISIGALWLPRPFHPFAVRACELFGERPELERRLAGFAVWNRAYAETLAPVKRGDPEDFYLIRATQWATFWGPNDLLERTDVLGYHLWWGAISRDGAFGQLTEKELFEEVPESLIVQYLKRWW